MPAVNQSLTVMEAGFKIRSGQESEFMRRQGQMIPTGMSQPGFVSVYGGPIVNSTWLYFGVRFETQKQMDDWYHHPAHQAVQRPAREKWWTAVYIRKWRRPVEGDAFGSRVFAETRIERTKPFDESEQQAVISALAALSSRPAAPFETLTGQFEPQPYQLVGPLEIAPSAAPTAYSLLTHWSSHGDLEAWRVSPDYARLAEFGAVVTEAFIPLVESGERLGLREDRLQRDWALEAR